jgi:hypothetical protein
MSLIGVKPELYKEISENCWRFMVNIISGDTAVYKQGKKAQPFSLRYPLYMARNFGSIDGSSCCYALYKQINAIVTELLDDLIKKQLNSFQIMITLGKNQN